MKFDYVLGLSLIHWSHPVRGAWIEIAIVYVTAAASILSHPVRGAWIEIADAIIINHHPIVAPREGCVD